jgi:hypothetical protein
MKYLVLLGGLALAVGSSHRVDALEVAIGRTKIELVGPKDFCPLDNNHSLDSQAINLIQQTVQGRNELLAVFINCARLADWHDGKTDDIGDTFEFQVSLKAKNVNANKASVTDICSVLRKQGAEIFKTTEGLMATNVKAIKELAGKIELNALEIYGVLHEDDTGCYFGSILKMKVEDKVELHFNVSAVTTVRNKLVFANHSSDFKDESTVQRLLATSQETVAAFRARNPDERASLIDSALRWLVSKILKIDP